MTGLDTNVLVRYIVQDDPVQSSLATKLFHSFSIDSPGFVSLVTLVELVWVLERVYGAGPAEIEAVVESLLRSRELMVERTDLIWRALGRFRRGSAQLADCLIESSGHFAGCTYTVTFDRVAAKGLAMQLLE